MQVGLAKGNKHDKVRHQVIVEGYIEKAHHKINPAESLADVPLARSVYPHLAIDFLGNETELMWLLIVELVFFFELLPMSCKLSTDAILKLEVVIQLC